MTDLPEKLWVDPTSVDVNNMYVGHGSDTMDYLNMDVQYTRTATSDLRIAELERELITSNEIGLAFEEDAGQQRGLVLELESVLVTTRALVTEAAMVGFNHADGDWADRLFANNGNIRAALKISEDDPMVKWSTDMESAHSGESYIVYAHGYVLTATKMGTHWMNKGEEIYPTHWMALPNPPKKTT
jgi:hypothetical protein